MNTQFFNVASTVTDGFNVEASYQFSLENWDMMSIPGSFTLRGLATYVTKFITNPGVPGGIVEQNMTPRTEHDASDRKRSMLKP